MLLTVNGSISMNDYKDQNLKSAMLTAGIIISLIIAIAIYVTIN